MHISKAYAAVEKDDVKVFRKEIISVRKDIHIFGPLKEYIQEVFRKAYIPTKLLGYTNMGFLGQKQLGCLGLHNGS